MANPLARAPLPLSAEPSALHRAVAANSAAATSAALAQGACPNAPGKHGDTPAMAACLAGADQALAALLAAGADPDERPIDPKTGMERDSAAFLAARQGSVGCLALLIAAGADLEAPGSGGRSPAMAAAARGNGRCLDLLLAAGASLCDEPWRGAGSESVASLARQFGHHELAAWAEAQAARRQIAASAAGADAENPCPLAGRPRL